MKDFKKNSDKALKVQLLINIIIFMIIVILPVVIIIYAKQVAAFSAILYILSVLMIILAFSFTILSAIVGYEIYSYKIDDKHIELIKGFLFKKHIYLPADKVQTIKIKNNIFCKDLCSIIFINDAYNLVIKNVETSFAESILKDCFNEEVKYERI